MFYSILAYKEMYLFCRYNFASIEKCFLQFTILNFPVSKILYKKEICKTFLPLLLWKFSLRKSQSQIAKKSASEMSVGNSETF